MMSRRLFFFSAAVVVFSLGVIIWFFVYTAPTPTPSLAGSANPLPTAGLPVRFQFLNKDEGSSTQTFSTTEVTTYTPQILTTIWKAPATGATFVSVDTLNQVTSTSTEGTTTITSTHFVHATGTILMFVDRTTGHIYGYDRGRNKTYQISNTTIPGIYDAYIFNNGKSVVFRYADRDKGVIVGALASVPSVNEEDQAEPLQKITYLPSQVTSVAVNRKATQLSYLVSNDAGSSVYTIDGDKRAAFIDSSPFKEWSLSYGNDSTLYATSRPSAYVEGETVRVPTFEFVVGEKTGLMSTPGDGGLLLNSALTAKGLKTFFTKGSAVGVLSMVTLASKCAWGDRGVVYCGVPKTLPPKSEGLPDDWFQGTASFDDTLVVADPRQNITYTLYSFDRSLGIPFDITNVVVSPNDMFISFTRKQDGSLWFLDTDLLMAD